jgi:hypothetical protein
MSNTHLAQRLTPTERSQVCVAGPEGLSVAGVLGTAALAALPFPPAAAFLGGLAALAGLSSFSRRSVPALPPPLPPGDIGWKLCSALLRTSPDELERAHYFMGYIANSERRVPALMHEKILWSHLHCLGPTGSRKTTSVGVPLEQQILQRGRDTCIFMDLKGGPIEEGNAPFYALCESANRGGVPGYYFSTNALKASHLFAGLSDPAFTELEITRQTRVLCESLAIEHGENAALAYYSVVNSKHVYHGLLLFHALARLVLGGKKLSFARLAAILRDPAFKKRIRQHMTRHDLESASHAANSIEVLSRDWRFNPTGEENVDPRLFDNMITIDKMLSTPGLFYFDLSAGVDATVARFLARFVIHLLHQRALNWVGPRVRVYICIDEAGEMLSRAVLLPLAQLRSLKISLWFLHQTLGDLVKDGADFTASVTGNPAIRITMGARDDATRDRLERVSGLVTRTLGGTSRSRSQSQAGQSDTEGEQTHEVREPRIDQDRVNEINADPALAVLEASPHSGYSRFTGTVEIEVVPSLSEEEFERYDKEPWPDADGVRSALGGEPLVGDLGIPAPPKPSREGKKKRPPKEPAAEREERTQDIRGRLKNAARKKSP